MNKNLSNLSNIHYIIYLKFIKFLLFQVHLNHPTYFIHFFIYYFLYHLLKKKELSLLDSKNRIQYLKFDHYLLKIKIMEFRVIWVIT
jgi:hypothetical protein